MAQIIARDLVVRMGLYRRFTGGPNQLRDVIHLIIMQLGVFPDGFEKQGEGGMHVIELFEDVNRECDYLNLC